MKNLEKKQLDTLLNIIGSTPSYQIAHFTQSGDTLVNTINDYCKEHEYFYQINCINKAFFERMSQQFKDDKTTKVFHFPLERRSYMMQAREYNFLFVSLDLEEEKKGDFLRKAHKIVRSAGNIIIFVEKKEDDHDLDSWLRELEENYFVSTSTMRDHFEHYDIIISKKMHGWGNR